MKMKIYTLTALCLFFFTKISAQNVDAVSSVGNQIDLTLLVKDGLYGQVFDLLAEDNHNVFHQQDMITYNISLNYQSTESTTSYFRLKCEFEVLQYTSPVIPDDFPFLGVTAPVIIPPVKKKKGENIRPIGTYPYLAEVPYRIHPRNYKVTIELLKYHTFDDYMANNNNYIVSTTKVIYLNANHDMPSASEVSMVTYPNPSIGLLTIEYANTTTENTSLNVVIFTNKGVQISQHTLIDSRTETNNSLYNLDTSHLQNGTYYIQLSREGKTQVKTIIKE